MPPAEWIALIVDDTPDNLEVAQVILESYGAEVHTAANGKECLRVLEKITPTFILLDISMPVMDGWTTVKHIRENNTTTQLTVIAMTAHVLPYDQGKVYHAGFDGYINKPVRAKRLVDYIQECLDGSPEKD
jgi:two-component system, sensor histidine kinase and response regulator